MKKIKNIIGILILSIFSFAGCEENNYAVGDLIAPTNLQVSAEIVGQNTDNPHGDGSAIVIFRATSDNEINYQFNFGDGSSAVSPTGIIEHRFSSNVGIYTYTVIVNATGRGGVGTSTNLEVTVFNSFKDEEVENFLTGSANVNDIGASKKWYWQADRPLHVGLGPVEDDYGNGEFAYEAWWNLIQPWDEEKYCMYDNEFVFTRTANGVSFEQTIGPAFVPGAYAVELGVDGDTCHDDTVATTMFGEKSVSFFPSTSKAALEGSYNEEPYRKTSFEISDGGFLGWYVGASTYDIISISETELFVRIIQAGNGYAWYQRFTSIKPVEGVVGPDYEYTNLVWEDDFNTDGQPDATKWTYDLGAGGWGNGEAQTYTDNSANVTVENGSLKINAIKVGSSYTSARIKSQGLFDFTYGRVEVSAKLPQSQGTWPAIWMLGSNFPTVGWPQSGEIDIMEQTGDDKSKVLGTCHWYETSNSSNASYSQSKSVANTSSEFHTYTMEWSEDAIKIYVDDEKYYELANNVNLPFDADFFIILNVAMGGSLGGTIDPSFTEDTMEIDYVKVYQ
ncbi:MAG: Beta-glucanase [Flavobacterium sp. SCGC AAA160-P02]|nr:MAG: Beta-glucanase [Flavobacterium sp. SCGC AAA160-P02]